MTTVGITLRVMHVLARSVRTTMPGPFDFTLHIRRLCDCFVDRLPELAHIDMNRVAVAYCQARRAVPHGLFASLTPLRFEGGASTTIRRGRPHTIQRVFSADGREMLYILRFYLPRFQNLDLREKLVTVLHELWHMHPEFNGDIRRHNGRYHAHTHSQAQYDHQMGRLADRWLATSPPPEVWTFLQDDFHTLAACHGTIVGLRLPRPRILPIQHPGCSEQPGCSPRFASPRSVEYK